MATQPALRCDASTTRPIYAKLRFQHFFESDFGDEIFNDPVSLYRVLGLSAHAEVVDFTLADANGVEHKLSDYLGKWLVINFWATWCAPCLKETPELSQFHNHHKDNDAIVLAIDFEEIDLASLRAFIKEQSMSYPVLRAGSMRLTPFEPLLGLPSTFLVSPQGMYVDKHVGPITLAQLEEFVAKNKGVPNQSPPTFSRQEIYLGVATFAVLLLITGAYGLSTNDGEASAEHVAIQIDRPWRPPVPSWHQMAPRSSTACGEVVIRSAG